jgi:hypothetical protein
VKSEIKSKNQQLKDDFQYFLSADEVCPPKGVAHKILQHVSKDLNPSFQQVWLKILGVHAIVSLVSLSLCSQFGFRTLPFLDLMNQFMDAVGSTYCMAFCGAIYLGLSALALSFLLKSGEIRFIRRNIILQMTLLAGVSLGVFLCFGANLLLVPTLLWISGSLVGGAATFETGWLVRSQFRKKLIYGR